MENENLKHGYSICMNEWAFDKEIKNELGLLLIISSLTAKNGYCYASNRFFSELFNVDEDTISRKIKLLERKCYITIEYDKRGCEVVERRIRLAKMSTDDRQKNQPTTDKNVGENNISINNTSINNEEEVYIEENLHRSCQTSANNHPLPSSSSLFTYREIFNLINAGECEIFIDNLMQRTHLKEDELMCILDEFASFNDAIGDKTRESDFKRHFFNWLKSLSGKEAVNNIRDKNRRKTNDNDTYVAAKFKKENGIELNEYEKQILGI